MILPAAFDMGNQWLLHLEAYDLKGFPSKHQKRVGFVYFFR